MLPIDTSLQQEGSACELHKLQSVIDSTFHTLAHKKGEMTQRRRGLSFMIDDILGNSESKKTNPIPDELPSSPCSQCLNSPVDKDSAQSSVQNLNSESHSFAFSQGSSRFLSSTTPIFVPPLSPRSAPARFGYYSPAIASSPPFSFSTRNSDVFTFLSGDLNEHLHPNYFNVRPDSLVRSSMYSPSVILDLTNYVQKSSNVRFPTSSVVALPSQNVDCSGNRQLIWKPMSRNTAKRKGGQIRFTNEQTTTLETTFAEHKYLSSTERKRLATALRLSERQVKTWFQNRRAKWRRIKQDPTGRASSSESEDCNPADELLNI